VTSVPRFRPVWIEAVLVPIRVADDLDTVTVLREAADERDALDTSSS
jgi:hypothetical protein